MDTSKRIASFETERDARRAGYVVPLSKERAETLLAVPPSARGPLLTQDERRMLRNARKAAKRARARTRRS